MGRAGEPSTSAYGAITEDADPAASARARQDHHSTLQPTMKKAMVQDVVDAVLYLAQAGHVSREILHVDGAAPARRW